MTSDECHDANDSQAPTGGQSSRDTHELRVIRSDKSQEMQLCFAMTVPSVSEAERTKQNGRYLAEKSRAECLFDWQQSGEHEAYSDADW